MAKRNRKKQKKAAIVVEIIVASVLAIAIAVGGWQYYRLYEDNFRSTDGESHLVYVYPETTISELMDTIEANYTIASPLCLRLHAKMLHWPAEGQQYVRTGCYRIPAKAGDLQVVRTFRNGAQEPIKLSFRNIRTKGQLSARLASQLMMDSASIARRLDDAEYMKTFGLRPTTAVCLFLPDTYEMYWDITPDALFQRMKREYDAFWNDERLAKAKALGYEPWQIATIASIVEEETNKDVDKPIIAGLYMNRLRIGMPLQACPTIKFAWQDFTLRRILNRHLEIDSPYNTYKNLGLPPGPIRIPTAKTLDYALNPVKSDYLFMCASDAFDGTHHFSSNYAAHAAYARQYQAALNKRGIK